MTLTVGRFELNWFRAALSTGPFPVRRAARATADTATNQQLPVLMNYSALPLVMPYVFKKSVSPYVCK